MKNVLMIGGLAFLGIAALGMSEVKPVSAYTQIAEFATSSATVSGIECSTSTPTAITAISGVRIGVRIQNQDATANVFVGFNSSVATSGANLGEKIVAGGNATYNIGRAIPLYCKSDGAASTWISVMQLAQ